jgi:hypothetical protein
MESRMKSYLRTDLIKHFLWLYENGFIEHFNVVRDIRNNQYNQATSFFKIFIYPYIKNIPDTMAAQENWFDIWQLRSYFLNMPIDFEIKLTEMLKKTCSKIYNNNIPQQIEHLLADVEKYRHGKWIKMLRKMIWGRKRG